MLKSKKLRLKKVVLISVLCVFLASILAAIIYPVMNRILQRYEKYNRITTSYDTEEQVWENWHYNGVKYSVAPGLSFYATTPSVDCTEENGFYLVSWYWYITQKIKIFGDSVEIPRYLYCPYLGIKRYVRVSENFDYMDEEYIIFNEEYIFYDKENFDYEIIRTDTEFSFKLKDVYYPEETIIREYRTKPIAYLSAYSKSFKRLEFYGDIYLIDGEYYIGLSNYGTSDDIYRDNYKVKPEFIELLRKADILKSDS